MTPKDHGPYRVRLICVGRIFQHAVDPAADRDAGQGAKVLVFAILALDGRELAFQPVQVFAPDACPVRPGAIGQPVIAGQGV